MLNSGLRRANWAAAALLLLAGCQGQAPEPADLIFHNAVIWTADDANPTAQAVAIREGRFSAVGSDQEVLRRRGDETQVVDLQGAFALPGFNDNHVHFQSAARYLEFNIMRTGTQEEFVERQADCFEALDSVDAVASFRYRAAADWGASRRGIRSVLADMLG